MHCVIADFRCTSRYFQSVVDVFSVCSCHAMVVVCVLGFVLFLLKCNEVDLSFSQGLKVRGASVGLCCDLFEGSLACSPL